MSLTSSAFQLILSSRQIKLDTCVLLGIPEWRRTSTHTGTGYAHARGESAFSKKH